MPQSNQNNVVIYGGGGHAKVITNIIRLYNDFELIGFLDDIYPENYGKELYGSYIIGGRDQLEFLLKKKE
jgi:FlaA1/EpsC-like NDP-sugar epimerase